jgi:hypothetical protein
MARTIQSAVEIDAPAERVWKLLTDFGSFPTWNPFIREAQGTLEPGAKLRIRLRVLGKRSLTFRPRVTRVEPNRELTWLARTGPPGVLDVERRFLIEPTGNGRVRFEQSEVCTGLLAPALRPIGMEASILDGYRAFERAIKDRAEHGR